jgi:hypothetical protein
MMAGERAGPAMIVMMVIDWHATEAEVHTTAPRLISHVDRLWGKSWDKSCHL